MTARRLRIFVSSPGDVGQERLIATRVIERLQGEFWGTFELEPVVWEHEPLCASAHFQEQIIPPSETDIVLCILWSRLGTRLPEQFCREDGSRYASGTEWEFEDALRSFRERGVPDLLVYRKTAEPHVSISDEAALLQRLEQKKALDAFIDRWFGNPHDSFRLAFHAFEAPDQFETLLETHLRKLLQQWLPAQTAEQPEAPVPIRWHQGSPFRGLEVFDIEHAPVFFGRTRAIAEIKEALLRQAGRGCAFVVALGMSGCGKSSLIRAGVLPTITQAGVIEGIGLWRWCLLRPSDGPEDLDLALAQSLLAERALPELADTGFDSHELAALFRQAPERAAAAIQMGLQRAATAAKTTEQLTSIPKARLVVVVDQLEELFRLAPVKSREREAFVAAISALARSGAVWVIATMRSDYYPRCAELPELVALKEGAGQYDVLPPSFAEIGQMIRLPARAAGLRFEVDPQTGDRLDDRLHAMAVRDPEALPLLEFTLDELYRERTESGVLTFAAYQRLGGLEGALARRAEEAFAAESPAVQAALPSVLRALVAVGPGREEMMAARRASLASVAATPERQALVNALIQARLLVTDRTDDGQALVRIGHEALLRHWPRLRKWLEEDRSFLQTRERVATAALRWREEARSADFLLPDGKPLAEALDLLGKRRDDLDAGTVEYIDTSRRVVTRARQRRLRLIAGVTSACLVAAWGFGAFSYGQWRRAEQQNRLALEAVNHLTYDIPRRLIDLPGSRPALRTIFQENLQLLQRVGGARAQEDERANFRYMGDIWLLLGDTEQADRAYRKSLAIAERLAKGRAGTAVRWELAVSEARLGDVSMERGDARGALAGYEPSLAILQGLAARDRNARLRRDLSSGYEKIGDARLALNDLPGALRAYQNDLAIAEELARSHSDAAERDLAVSHIKIGDVRLAAGDAPGALGSYEESASILSNLSRGRGDAGVQRDLAASLAKVGDAYLALHQPGRAKEPYLQALTISRKLAWDRTNARAQRDLWVSLTRIGELSLALGHAPEALRAYQNSLTIAQGLAADKSNATAQQDLKFIYEKIRDIEASQGHARAALIAHENSLRAALDLIPPTNNAAAQQERARLYQEIGSTRVQRRDLNGALEAYQQATEIVRALAANGGDAQAERDLAAAYDKVAYVELLRRRPQEAIALAVEGLAADPRQVRLEATLAHGYLFTNQFDRARALYLENQARRVDDRESFADAVLADFREFRAQGLGRPEMGKIERLLSTTRK